MKHLYKSYVIEYRYHHTSSADPTILLLHGWGGDLTSLDCVLPSIKKRSHISISLPPYGDSILPLAMNDYRQIVYNVLAIHNISSVVIICHSFGFRLAMLLYSHIHPKAIIATGAAGIRARIPLFRRLHYQHLSIANKYGAKHALGSSDYSALDSVDRETFRHIVTLDLRPYAVQVSCPTLLYYGRDDQQTPIKHAKIWSKIIKNSTLKIVHGGHFAHIENMADFQYTIREFLKNI